MVTKRLTPPFLRAFSALRQRAHMQQAPHHRKTSCPSLATPRQLSATSQMKPHRRLSVSKSTGRALAM
ncbi:hypothetical protein CKO32_00790 [Afifella marina DSM 2698]|nr:hypothetical protein [Afifella marina DSM 2698]